jgi:hypothetical protein
MAIKVTKTGNGSFSIEQNGTVKSYSASYEATSVVGKVFILHSVKKSAPIISGRLSDFITSMDGTETTHESCESLVSALNAFISANVSGVAAEEKDPEFSEWKANLFDAGGDIKPEFLPDIEPEDIGAATAEQGKRADEAYQKPAGGIPLSDLAPRPYTYTATKTGRKSSDKFGNRDEYEIVLTATLKGGNDTDGVYFTIPNFYKLVDCRGIVVNNLSLTRMPVPCMVDGAGFITPRVTDTGDVWIRAYSTKGDFSGMEITLFVRCYLK